MTTRRFTPALSLRLARLPAMLLPVALLVSCGGPKAPPPLTQAALNAVVKRPGAPHDMLARAVDNLFTDPAVGETRALLILHNGSIVAERYAEGYTKDTRLIGWSMSKTVTGLLIGLLISDGRLQLDEPAPVPAWRRAGDPRGEITLRHLLQMRSGLHHVESAEPAGDADTVRMLVLDGRDDMAAYAQTQPLESVAGSKWEYSTATSVILADIAARALTESKDPAERRQAVADYLQSRLFTPLGMTSAVPEFDAAGTLIGGSMVHATARDWAKLGEFLRNGGTVKGAQILPSDWVGLMVSPAPHNAGYGMQIWRNAPQPNGQEELFPARGPRSIFAMIGHLGQYTIVSPDQHLTIVRLGKTDSAKRAALVQRLGDIVELYKRD